jgi:sortase A
MRSTGSRRYGLWRFGWATAAVLVAGAIVVAVPALRDTGQVAAPSPAAPLGSAQGPPSFDQVLKIRDELRAAADTPDYPVDQAQLATVATAPGPYVSLGRIAFPTTGLDVEVGAGVQPAVLDQGPGHWPGTALAGQPGNAVISGHRTTHTHPFGDLDLLEPGDPIDLTPSGASTPVIYRVTGTTIVPEAEYAQFVLAQPTDPAARELTLFACHPKGRRTHRIVVRAAVQQADVGQQTDAGQPTAGGS